MENKNARTRGPPSFDVQLLLARVSGAGAASAAPVKAQADQGDGRWLAKELALAYEKLKARIRAKVEHPCHGVKNIFQHKKVRYKGVAKNDAQLHTQFGARTLSMIRL